MSDLSTAEFSCRMAFEWTMRPIRGGCDVAQAKAGPLYPRRRSRRTKYLILTIMTVTVQVICLERTVALFWPG